MSGALNEWGIEWVGHWMSGALNEWGIEWAQTTQLVNSHLCEEFE